MFLISFLLCTLTNLKSNYPGFSLFQAVGHSTNTECLECTMWHMLFLYLRLSHKVVCVTLKTFFRFFLLILTDNLHSVFLHTIDYSWQNIQLPRLVFYEAGLPWT